MRHILGVFFVFSLITTLHGQDLDYLKEADCEVVLNESYGKSERNKFDIFLPRNENIHGLVIYIHGGGFFHGDKSELYTKKEDILTFLQNNIAIATINYRYYRSDDSLGVKVCLNDIKQALQYIRFNSQKYNIDKERVGIYGGSAGAGASLYFAFQNDMALVGDTTLLGESTRIRCAGAFETQSTYDVFAWKGIIPWFRLITVLKRKTLYNSAANFYGYKNYKSFKARKKEITNSLDMLSMIDSNAPPIYLMNLMEEKFPINNNIIQHHKKHAIAVSKKLKKFNIKHHLYTSKDIQRGGSKVLPFSEFIIENLK